MSKQLKLTGIFKKKLEVLKRPPSRLLFEGAELDTFIGRPLVAIVGTRKPTAYGRSQTERFAAELAKSGAVIVSGLAFGVDSLAHKACLKAGGQTIAILPSGLNHIYPANHEPLAREISRKGGCLVSEYPDAHKPFRAEFLERNRIIAALSDLVLIPEATINSGSLNTAAHAKRLGIPICIIPGPVTSQLSEGTNSLLKSGAHAVTGPDDVLELLGIKSASNRLGPNLIGDSEEETAILESIAAGMHEPHALQASTSLGTSDFQTALSLLEIAGRVKQDSLGNWHLE